MNIVSSELYYENGVEQTLFLILLLLPPKVTLLHWKFVCQLKLLPLRESVSVCKLIYRLEMK